LTANATTVPGVSDLPPPPPAVPPPPPPPPNLVAPPNYAGYAGGPIGSVPLKRVGGLAKVVMALVALAGLMPLVDLAMRQTVVDEADRYLAGGVSDTDFTEEIIGYVLITTLSGFVTVAAAVLTMIWMFRVARNHRRLHRGGTWGPGWAIGGWFLPPVVYIIPTLMLGEMWKASDPDVPVGGEWKSRPASPLPWVWLLVYCVPTVIAFSAESDNVLDQFRGTEEALAEQITGSQTTDTVVAIASLIAAGLFVVIVRQITDRHRRLTGEATTH
jgi:hypothetical protein